MNPCGMNLDLVPQSKCGRIRLNGYLDDFTVKICIIFNGKYSYLFFKTKCLDK